ncbi:MAG: hypothetical protein LBT97_04775 [Planctomycetota bacterium]|jgi:hypothetical protein|nr:hypothetical protein [Planctomycetota bacterium]
MKTSIRTLRLFAALLAAALSAGPSCRAAEITFPDLLPASTIACLVPPDERALEYEYRNSLLRSLAAMPEAVAFFQSLERSRQEFAMDLAAGAGVGPDLAAAILNGRFGFALLKVTLDREGRPAPEFAACIALPFEPDRNLVFQAVGNMLNRREVIRLALESQGLDPNTPIRTIAQEEIIPGYPPLLRIGPDIRMTVVGRMILYHNGRGAEGIRGLLDSLANPQAALSSQPLYQACLRGAEASPGAAFTFVNIARLLPLLDVSNLGAAGRILDSLGVSTAQGLGLSGSYRGEGIRHNLYLHWPGERSGLLSALASMPPDATAGMEAFAQATPAETGGFAALRLDVPAFLDEIPYFADAVGGVARPGGIASLISDKTVLGVPVGEIARVLGSDLAIRPHDDAMVLLFNNVDIQGFERIITHMERNAGAKFRSAAVGKYQVRYFNQFSGLDLPAAPAFCLIPRAQTPGRGVLYAASFPQAIVSLIQEAAAARESLANDADFRKAMAGLEGNYSMFYYTAAGTAYRRAYNTLLPLASLWAGSSHYPVDTGLLPPASAIVPKMFGVALGIRNHPQGISLQAYSPIGIHGLTVVLFDRLVASNPLVLAWAYSWASQLKSAVPAW